MAEPRDLHAVDVFALARDAGSADGRLELRHANRLRESLVDDAGALEFVVRGFEDRWNRPAAELLVRGVVTLVCDHCGNPYAFPLTHRAEYRFVAAEAELEQLPVTVDEIEPLVGSRQFDLLELVEDEAILSLPLSPRHPECAAAVAASGAESGSASEQRQRPFSVLADLKRRMQ
jgi:uncharacterized protein